MTLWEKGNGLPHGPFWWIYDPQGKVLPVTGIISCDAMMAAAKHVHPGVGWMQEMTKWDEMKAAGYRCVARWKINGFDDRYQISKKEWDEKSLTCACDDWRADMCTCEGTCACHWEMRGD